MEINAALPEKLEMLFRPMRYKVAYGGRGGGKSHSFAIALLALAAQKPMRILCAREIQKSIKDSVHRLISDKIQILGLGSFFDILETEIRGANGSLFLFSGLSSQTVESLKSFEGVDICWVEEAKNVSKRSWDILGPTIRKAGSEIWISFNPELETDETYQRFVLNPPDDCISVEINYPDNPFKTLTQEKERLSFKRQFPKEYDNIWLGKCKPAVEAAIYYDEIAEAREKGRIANAPYDRLLKVHVVFDLGWNDAMSIALVQRSASEIRVIEYIEDSHKTLDHYSNELKAKKYNWGQMYLPHDARARDYKYGKSAEEIMKALGWDVRITPNMSIEDGIRQARLVFGRCYFDQTNTARLVECLRRYRRQMNNTTNQAGAPLHDEYSHGADCFRYIAVNAEKMTNDDYGDYAPLPQYDSPLGLSWG